jgi:hypothetical protein
MWGLLDERDLHLFVAIGTPGDKYEQEADSVAAQVMSMSVPATNSGLVQRQGEEEETEPLVQRSPLADSITPLVQHQPEEQEEQTEPLVQKSPLADSITPLPLPASRVQT